MIFVNTELKFEKAISISEPQYHVFFPILSTGLNIWMLGATIESLILLFLTWNKEGFIVFS